MLSFKFVADAVRAGHYFESSDDYYGREGHRGEWGGAGAAALGLEGQVAVDRAIFQSLLDGRLPDGRQLRTHRTRASADRKGIDFTFSAPKSVSIQALVLDDARVIAAHDAAVRKSLTLLESFAAARRKAHGLSFRERTGHLVVAMFRHELSRAQDPQLHTHAVVMNLTRRADGHWRALSNEDLLRNVRLVGAFYRSTLAEELRALGFELRETRRGGWELAQVPEAVIRRFSQRSREIELLLAARGQARESATTAQKQMLTLASRQRKSASDRAWLREHWRAVAQEAGLALSAPTPRAPARTADSERPKPAMVAAARRAADDAVDFAIAHLAERQGIFSRAELLEIAYGRAATRAGAAEVEVALERARGDGRLEPELPLYQTARSLNIGADDLVRDPHANRFKGHDEAEKLTRASWVALTMARRGQTRSQAEMAVDQAIARGALVPAESRFATPEARSTERRILALEHAGRAAVAPITGTEAVQAMLAASSLNAGQRDAVRMVLTAPDRFVGIQGLAGTGKSHMLARAVEAIKAESSRLCRSQGFRVFGLAPYASQNEALARLGMQSQTLASFLARRSQHDALDARAIVFLDEAGVVPAHQLERLMTIIEARGARLVLCGDRLQTHAVEAGKPFEQLQDAGMTRACLTEVQRQRNMTIRAAVVYAAAGAVPQAVAQLAAETVEIAQEGARYARLAGDYVRLSPEERRETLIVAGTNEARRAINALVRQRLAMPEGERVAVLEPVDMTRAELRSVQSYEAGQVVVPQRTHGALRKGELLRVLAVLPDAHELQVQRPDGRSLRFDPASQPMLRVYEPQELALSAGDWVRVTANDHALCIFNGERYEVAAVDAGTVTLRGREGGIRMDRGAALYLQHGYASTIHSAQGLTRDRVLIEANTKSLSSNRAVFYVAISRPRDHLTVYTDDAGRLATAMGREPKKYAALELRDRTLEERILKTRLVQGAARHLAQALRRAGTGPPALDRAAAIRR